VYICHCNALTDRDIEHACTAGAQCPRDVYNACGCKAQCGSCTRMILSILRDLAPVELQQAA
jgi:bacterioferritin-associated ferredoxin